MPIVPDTDFNMDFVHGQRPRRDASHKSCTFNSDSNCRTRSTHEIYNFQSPPSRRFRIYNTSNWYQPFFNETSSWPRILSKSRIRPWSPFPMTKNISLQPRGIRTPPFSPVTCRAACIRTRSRRDIVYSFPPTINTSPRHSSRTGTWWQPINHAWFPAQSQLYLPF